MCPSCKRKWTSNREAIFREVAADYGQVTSENLSKITAR